MDILYFVLTSFNDETEVKKFNSEKEAAAFIKLDVKDLYDIETMGCGVPESKIKISHADDWSEAEMTILTPVSQKHVTTWRIIRVEDGEKPVLKTITAISAEDIAIEANATVTLVCEVPDKAFDLTGAVYAAAEDFMTTPEGKKTYESCCGFSLDDFIDHVPVEICKKHGFIPLKTNPEPDIYWEEALAEPEEEE